MIRLIKILACCFGFLIISVALTGCQGSAIPTDKELKNNFYESRIDYELIAKEVLRKNIRRIELHNNGSLEVIPNTIDVSKDEVYKKLFREKFAIDLLGASYKQGTDNEITEISFYQYRSGFVFGGDDKGIVYFVGDQLPVTTDSLDVFGKVHNKFPPSGQRIYKKLDGRWYLFYEYFD